MDKNEREKKKLYEWGKQHDSEYYFPMSDKEKMSYFIKRKADVNSYIKEYGFETFPEFMNELDGLWGNDEIFGQIKKVIGIAALKNKPCKVILEKVSGDSSKETGKKKEGEDRLPIFIYNF